MKKIIIVVILLLGVFLLFFENGSGPSVSQNGISPNQFADDLISKYDSDSDGKLSVTSESFLKTEIENTVKTESRGLLFTDADVFGNADGSVSQAELMNYLGEFDTDNDGELTGFKNVFDSMFGGENEWEKFNDKYEERFKYD